MTYQIKQVGFIDGQLLANGADRDLIAVVISGDRDQINLHLAQITDPDKRDRLASIINRIIKIQTKHED